MTRLGDFHRTLTSKLPTTIRGGDIFSLWLDFFGDIRHSLVPMHQLNPLARLAATRLPFSNRPPPLARFSGLLGLVLAASCASSEPSVGGIERARDVFTVGYDG